VKKRIVVLLAALLLFSNLLTYRATTNYYRWRVDTPPSSSPETNNGLSELDDLQTFYRVLEILAERHLEEVTVEELVDAAIKGMVGILDEQTRYMGASDWQRMMETTSGTFSGIGIEIIAVDGYITVIAPIKGTPGERAGLMPEDRIVEVDGADIRGISTMEAVSLIRGTEGTTVTLKVLRGEDETELIFEIVRGSIVMPSVFSEMMEEKIGYIGISNFDQHSSEDFSVALMELENKGMDGLILDLRGNPGGLLSEAVRIGQDLLPAGPITYVVDRDGNKINTYHSYGAAKLYPIVVLVNKGSASASEIIAGAIQDTGVGVLVGTETFGKATVQHLEELDRHAGLSYTIAKYRTPNGRDIHGVGLTPDVVVELPASVYLHPLTLDMKKGDENSNVTFLQQALNIVGYEIDSDGIFDESTENAVRDFQRANGLQVTGLVKQDTRKKLQEAAEAALEKMDTQKQKALEIILEKIS
jgi:carboxyl-terminal processing protease